MVLAGGQLLKECCVHLVLAIGENILFTSDSVFDWVQYFRLQLHDCPSCLFVSLLAALEEKVISHVRHRCHDVARQGQLRL